MSDELTERGSHREEEKPHSASNIFFQSNAEMAELQCSHEMARNNIPEDKRPGGAP
jgi:hypothetical protein